MFERACVLLAPVGKGEVKLSVVGGLGWSESGGGGMEANIVSS